MSSMGIQFSLSFPPFYYPFQPIPSNPKGKENRNRKYKYTYNFGYQKHPKINVLEKSRRGIHISYLWIIFLSFLDSQIHGQTNSLSWGIEICGDFRDDESSTIASKI